MKSVRFLAAVCALFLSAASASAQPASQPRKIIVIDGCFFHEMPVATDKITGVHFLKTPSGASAVGFELSEPLPDAALRYAVPAEQIPEASVLLEEYNKAKALGSGTSLSFVREPLLEVGSRFPDFSATDLDGRTWTSADIAGKVMVLNLWFTGCGPCRAEMPELSRWKEEMPDVMFFSSTYENAERARPVLEKQGFNWIPLVGDTQFRKFVGSNGYPVTIVVDKQGIVSQVEYGTSPVQRDALKATVRSLR